MLSTDLQPSPTPEDNFASEKSSEDDDEPEQIPRTSGINNMKQNSLYEPIGKETKPLSALMGMFHRCHQFPW